MNTAAVSPLQVYAQPLVGRIEGALRNCLIGAAVLGVVALLIVFLAPAPPVHEVRLEEIPERYAKLILEKPTPVAAPPAPVETVAVMEMPEQPLVAEPTPALKPVTRPKPQRRADPKPKVARARGVKGRQKAETEVKAELAKVTGSLDKALDQLAVALPAAGAGDDAASARKPKRRRGRTRGGRSGAQVAVATGVTDLKTTDLGGTALAGQGVAIAGIADLDFGDAGGNMGGGGGSGVGGASGRSSESLLAVVRRYAPGIQFCYENELKKNSGLRGKLVVSLTVLSDGSMADVIVVEDSLGSDAVTGCAVAQMQGWQFPAIQSGVSTFKAPFVFTPPDS